jgi:hypothetical protein
MKKDLTSLLASVILENAWWLQRETRYITVIHQLGCSGKGLSDDTCNCNPEIRLMYNATAESNLRQTVPQATVSGIPAGSVED